MKRTATLLGMAAVVLTYAVLGYERRWISDDGMIFVRIARQIGAGHGPVFNAFERVEANTSTLWTWILALAGKLRGGDLAPMAVVLGLGAAVAGVALAMDGTRRWHRLRGSDAILVPGSALVVVGIVPFWDYATSGLETGLTLCWLGLAWWLFATLVPGTPPRRQLASAIAFGLGPLVRPDLGIASIALMLAAYLIVRPPWRRTLALFCAAIALPFAYEIFRAGYYGVLVPLPALAKGASGSQWGLGLEYLLDFATPYLAWLPFAALGALLVVVAALRGLVGRDRIVAVTPIAIGLAMGLYVTRVGGDFMHGRMLLPATFACALPGMVVPLRRISAPAVAIVAGWAIVIAIRLGDNRRHTSAPLVEDERLGYVWLTHHSHPITSRAYREAIPGLEELFDKADRDGDRLFCDENTTRYPLDPHAPARIALVAGHLGMSGSLTPLDGITVDTLGLANPIGARIEVTRPDEHVGHQKVLPWSWILADLADPAHYGDTDQRPREIAAARHAMSCGELRELLDSVREPLTIGRFFANLVGSVRRTRLVVPSDPAEAELELCGTESLPSVTASSSHEADGWAKDFVVDGVIHGTFPHHRGYSSEIGAPQWLALDFPVPRIIATVTMYPRMEPGYDGAGFPSDLSIEAWDGRAWIVRATRTFPSPPTTRQTIALDVPVFTSKLRVVANRLREIPNEGPRFQLAEIEVGP